MPEHRTPRAGASRCVASPARDPSGRSSVAVIARRFLRALLRGRLRSGGSGPDRERRGVDLPLVLEVEEEAVRAAAGRGGRERDAGAGFGRAVAGFAVRVDVEVGEVAGAQGDEVAVRAEVGLEVGDGLAVPGDVQLELARLAGAQTSDQLDLVTVHLGRGVRGGQVLRLVGAGDGEVRAEGEVLGALRRRG